MLGAELPKGAPTPVIGDRLTIALRLVEVLTAHGTYPTASSIAERIQVRLQKQVVADLPVNVDPRGAGSEPHQVVFAGVLVVETGFLPVYDPEVFPDLDRHRGQATPAGLDHRTTEFGRHQVGSGGRRRQLDVQAQRLLDLRLVALEDGIAWNDTENLPQTPPLQPGEVEMHKT